MAGTSTSMLLAAACVRQARRDRDPAVQRNAALARACLQGCGAAGRRLLWAVDHAFGRLLLRLSETLYLPGIGAHYAWRKRHIRRWALQACERAGAGRVRQLVVLGAGFDGLSLRLLARAPALRAFEIDRAHSVAIKRAALAQIGVDDPRLVLVGADLACESIEAVLRAMPGFDPGVATLVIAEGVLMYLAPAELRALVRGLARTLPQAQLIATAMALRTDATPGFARQRPWVGGWLRRAGEPFRWGATRAGLDASLREAGVELHCVADPLAPADPDPSPGEWVFAGALMPETQGGSPTAAPARR